MGAKTSARTEEPTWHGLEELRGALRCFLLRYCRDPNEIEDVIQETFVRAARYRRNLAEASRLKPWTMRIAVNVLLSMRRRAARLAFSSPEEVPLEAIVAADAPSEEEPVFRLGPWRVEKDAALGHLSAVLPSLRWDDRALLSSFYGGGGSCLETARALAIPEHLVKIRLFRARQRLLRVLRRRLALHARRAPRGVRA